MTRLLGIDPGLRSTGYGCLDVDRGRDPVLVDAGVLRLQATADLSPRLEQLHRDLESLLEDLRPDRLAVEGLFSHPRRARTAILMAHARGVILQLGEARGLPVDELPPALVKKAIAGHGNATKAQVQEAVRRQLGLSVAPSPHDISDALAVALCAARRLDTPSPEPTS